MNNQFTQRVSDIIMYSKEEANRLRNSYIGPEHLLLGLIREGEGKAIEILFNLQINLQDIKNQLEAIVKNNAENDTTYDENISFNDKASKVLKLCILEAKLLRNIAADSEHILLAIMKVKDNAAFHVLESNGVTYEKIKLTLQPDTHAGLGFSEDEDEDEDIRQSPSGNKSSPSTMADLPTPGSPIKIGLFFLRRLNICASRSISFTRPTTGSSFPSSAAFVMSVPKLSSTGVSLAGFFCAGRACCCAAFDLLPLGL